MRNNLVVLFFAFFVSLCSIGQNIDKAKLDSYFEVLEKNNKFMGSVAISHNGKIVYKNFVGFADVENKIAANENSKYRIGSISKTFTAVLVLKAIEENKIQLNQTIESFFPTITNANKITIEHLLRHRSGIHNFTSDEDYLTWNTKPKSKEEMVKIITNAGSDFEPDSKAEYSNSNFVLLTYLLEEIYKQPYAQLITNRITRPISLNNTYLGGKIDVAKNETKSYTYYGDWKVESETDISIPLGAGGIVSTPSDLVKFGDALFNEKLLSKESLDKMMSMKDNFGLGLFHFPFNAKMAYGHNGGIDGFLSTLTHFPNEKITYALTSNGINYDFNSISIAVLSEVFDVDYSIPTFKEYDILPEELDQYLGLYSSKEFPLKITITKENNVLYAQATGQSSFPLDAIDKHKFSFDLAGIVLSFNPDEHSLILEQGGGKYKFMKE
ncbi:serine hydrolase [Mesonia sp. K7]|uniref:serine hydrolase domain-containing protein n=1 Tax=Mesonia sp. K7 TaxID=2218606 RepID=UPI000DA803BF|nr:serine hydrolase domain-containing protein [Mesonia sp. K7]PZD79635.1 peptidase [Mesonia sp. K7]